ncbi:uncharacterized protein LOC133908504 [Phragmites australis]|uniref:uncharacterized protein LOC133908504 n=1 Tax=Phragmites australis TaxID=29695 RepID=UPI002D76E45D|nr:uncharacterized protein LOC133908504 [Phragmites australis]XP_062206549.1 uncharacterized protein LOC133908504 [Phragmites australis]XP_062206550.1 uncharacterized protein LOC133908504 [Phragmites australis]
MADHFALMTGRLLTESTLLSAIHDDFAIPSTKASHDQPDPSSVPEDVQLSMGKAKSGVMVECRICQEEGDEAYMATPCSCKGSLKYAHHICVQRWCNEKGDTICEICLQQFTPNYTAPSKLFRHGRNPISFRGAGERQENRSTNYDHTADQADGASSFDTQSSNPKGVIYCRVAAIALMALLVLRDAISLILGGTEVYSMALITLLMFRTAEIIIPVYIILVTVTVLLHRYNQQQIMHETPVSEPGGAGGLQPMPPQQQQHIINIQ